MAFGCAYGQSNEPDSGNYYRMIEGRVSLKNTEQHCFLKSTIHHAEVENLFHLEYG